MEIVVFGAGSLGSLVGGLLAREHDVTLVAREDHAAAVREQGLRLSGEFDERVRPAATTDGRGLAADLAVVTVKAFDTPAAVRELATGTFDAVLSLQNGMGNEGTLADALEPGATVLAGTATYGAVLREPGHVACTGAGEVVLGAREGGRSRLAERAADTFARAGIEATASESMPRRLWEKLAVNAGINPVTALAAAENDAVRHKPARGLARAAARETARVARADGVRLSNREALAALSAVAEATAANASSMRQDVDAGRRTEVDAINGYVVDRADARGIDAPTNATLAALVRTWERERELR